MVYYGVLWHSAHDYNLRVPSHLQAASEVRANVAAMQASLADQRAANESRAELAAAAAARLQELKVR